MRSKELAQDRRFDLSSKLTSLGAGFALFFLTIFVHGISVWNGFVLNDTFFVQSFRALNKEDWPGFWLELFSHGILNPFSEALTKATIAFDYQSGRMVPSVYHVSNLVMHGLCVLLAYLTVTHLARTSLRLSEDKATADSRFPVWLAFLCAAFFAVHPLVADSVACISNRHYLLASIFALGSINLFVVAFLGQSVLKAVLAYFAAFLLVPVTIAASPLGIALPTILLGLAFTLKEKSLSWKEFLFEKAYEIGACAFIAFVCPFLYLLPQAHPCLFGLGQPMLGATAYMASQFKALAGYYLPGFIAPLGFSVLPFGVTASSWLEPLTLAGILLFAVAFALSGWFFRKAQAGERPLLMLSAFGVFLVPISYLPEIFLHQAEVANTARFYLPCFGLLLALCSFFFQPQMFSAEKLFNGKKLTNFGVKLFVSVSSLLMVLSALSTWRDYAFHNNSALFRGVLKANPDNAFARAAYSFLLLLEGGKSMDLAKIQADRALKLEQNLPCAYLVLGNSASQIGKSEEARYYFEKALKLAEDQKLSPELLAYAKAGLAMSLSDLGEFKPPEKVRLMAEEALKYFPSNPRLYLALGKSYAATERPEAWENACRQYDKGRHFDPNDLDFVLPEVLAALNTGYPIRFEQAYGGAKLLKKLRQAPLVDLLIARAALETGRIKKGNAAISDYLASGAPPSAELFVIASALAKQDGKTDLAKEYEAKALKLDKDALKKVHLFLVVPPRKTMDEVD